MIQKRGNLKKFKSIFFLGWPLIALILVSALICGPLALYSQDKFPKPVGYVNDFANIIPANIEQAIEAIGLEVQEKTGAQIAVVTVETVGEEYYSEYANKLFAAWGIGGKGEDNGVLLFNTIKERRLWVEVGYGLEGILPDGLVGAILDNYVVPYYRKGDFGRGLLEGTKAIAGVIAKDAGVEITGAIKVNPPRRAVGRKSSGFNFVRFILFLLFIFFFLGGRGGLLPWLFLGGLGHRGRHGSRGGFGGWGSGGGFGGGFGGFGGGMSGGGGAGRGY
jgi:uncharacterized protein